MHLPPPLCVSEMRKRIMTLLLPLALQRLTEREWGEIWVQSPEYGWCIVEPQEGYVAPVWCKYQIEHELCWVTVIGAGIP